MPWNLLTRRRLLGAAGTAAVGLAGCSSSDDSDDGGSDSEPSGPPAYTDWLPMPEAISYARYSISLADLAEIRQYEDSFDGDVYDRFTSIEESDWFERLNLAFGDVSSLLTVAGSINRLSGEFDTEALTDSLAEADENVPEQGDHAGYAIYANGYSGVAISEGALVTTTQSFGTGSDEIVEILQAMIDASRGEATRQVEENSEYRELVDTLGSGTFVLGETTGGPQAGDPEDGLFSGVVAKGTSVQVEGSDSTVRYVDVYEEEDDVDMDALDEWIENDRRFGVADVTTRQIGRTTLVEASIRTSLSGFRGFFRR